MAWEQLELQVRMEFESVQEAQDLDRDYAETIHFLLSVRCRGLWNWGDGSTRKREAANRSCACGAQLKKFAKKCSPCTRTARRLTQEKYANKIAA